MSECSRSPDARAALALLGAALVVVTPGVALRATHVAAGTTISSFASATYSVGADTRNTTSNTVSLKVDEIVDVAVAARGDPQPVAPGEAGRILSFTVTNGGNGPEAFRLEASGARSGDDFDPVVTGVSVDSNGNGVYDPGVDPAPRAGGATAPLDPDGAVTVFVVSTIPTSATDRQRGEIGLKATAVTGSGPPGTIFAGKGDGGGDAIVGATTASGVATNYYLVGAAAATLAQRSAVVDPFGGMQTVSGSIVTYFLDAKVAGSTPLPAVQVADDYPEGTSYRPGSLTVDGLSVSDQPDGDAGTASATGIVVRLGDMTASTPHTISFKVKVK